MTDIAERLEAEAKLAGSDKWMLQEAADTIRLLRAEIHNGKAQSKEAIRDLRAEIARLQAGVKEAEQIVHESGVRLGEAHREIARLKALLEKANTPLWDKDASRC